MWTTLLSFINSSFVLAHIASMTESASSSFLYSLDIHSSRSTVAAVGFLISFVNRLCPALAYPGVLASSPFWSYARSFEYCAMQNLCVSFSHRL
jgi:hypothetical protein